MKKGEIRKSVREGYAKVVKGKGSCCGPSASSSCDISKEIGYSEEELKSVPQGANLGLGCGNPVALASLRKGEVVLDLGSGGGLDGFLAAQKVGPRGRVIGVDMTPEMIDRARVNTAKFRHKNVEFRLGEIENLPVADDAIDVVISNCVINLSPNKRRVFEETFRVLKPQGRLMISDIVLSKKLPVAIRRSVEAYIGCISGAVLKGEYLRTIRGAGFTDVKVIDETIFPLEHMVNDPSVKKIIKELKIPLGKVREIADSIVSVKVSGVKPSTRKG
jgi:arsenite methyltransferase